MAASTIYRQFYYLQVRLKTTIILFSLNPTHIPSPVITSLWVPHFRSGKSQVKDVSIIISVSNFPFPILGMGCKVQNYNVWNDIVQDEKVWANKVRNGNVQNCKVGIDIARTNKVWNEKIWSEKVQNYKVQMT